MTNEESGRAEAEIVAESAEGGASDGQDEAVERGHALVLAGLHLRLGSLALARAELETLAGRGALDAIARIDLAEVRWRTGDLAGGGEAAREALAGGGEAVVALVVAAEAASALGRPSEARRLAGQAMTLNDGPIDPVFAGMPRSSVWPSDPSEPVPSPATLFPPERVDSAIDADREGAALTAADDREILAAAEADAAAAADVATASGEPGLWDLHEAAAVAAAAEPGPPELEPSALFDAGRAALEAGDRATAAIHLGLVVRLAPSLAPAVLSVIGQATDAGLHLVQGDAYRAVGHESEARLAYAAAREAATAPAESSEPPAEPRSEAGPAVAPVAGPAETALWWLEPKREAEPFVEPEPEPEPEGPPEFESPTEPEAPREFEPPAESEPPPAEPEPEAPPDFEPPAESEPPPAEPEASAEFQPEPGVESAQPEPGGEPEWRADDAEPHDQADQWRSDT